MAYYRGSGKSREISVGNTPLGGKNPVRIQSMTKTDTRDVQATLHQCQQAFDAGADYMRISVPDTASLKAFEKIKSKLILTGYNNPLIADIHYRYDLAVSVAAIADKLRINPANFGLSPPRLTYHAHGSAPKDAADEGSSERLTEHLAAVAEACKKHGTAIRLGANAGSLRDSQHINKALVANKLVHQTIEYIDILEKLDFYNMVISVKTSHPAETAEASRLMYHTMQNTGKKYPLHIGVTESGMGVSGRIASALGIIPLLQDGIGDTIRVSLTEAPAKEIHFARQLLHGSNEDFNDTFDITVQDDDLQIVSHTNESDRLIAGAVHAFLALPGQPPLKHITIKAPNIADQQAVEETARQMMQQAGIKTSGTRFISCPACARASSDMEELCRIFSKELAAHPGVTMAIMGCVVNGPGEMTGADYGIIATSPGKINVYEGGVCIMRNTDIKEAIRIIRNSLSASGS